MPTIQINSLMAFRQPPGIWCFFSPSHEVDELCKRPSPGLHISQRLLEASSSNQHMWSLIPWLLQTRADVHLAQPTFSEIFCKIPQKQGILPLVYFVCWLLTSNKQKQSHLNRKLLQETSPSIETGTCIYILVGRKAGQDVTD